MGTSLVKLGDKGFWVNDGLLKVWLHFLADEMDAVGEKPDWLKELYERCRNESIYGGVGCVFIYWSEYVTTEERKDVVLSLCQKALTKLQGYGEAIPNAVLKSIGMTDYKFDAGNDLPTERVTLVGEGVMKVLRGEINTDASTSRWRGWEGLRDL